jgi:hypothetical protein
MNLILLDGGNRRSTAAWPGYELGAGGAWFEPDVTDRGPTGYRPLRDVRR